MQPSNETRPQRRYSCHECREDAEFVMSDRATASATALYHGHIGECRDCRRMHRLLYALYEGPVIPAPPAGLREEKEFHATLRRARQMSPQPWYQKLTIRVGIVTLAGSAAVLALALFDVTPSLTDVDDESAGTVGGIASSASYDHSKGSLATDSGGIHHPAQSYGRIVGGNATVITDGGDTATTTTFPVGTHFSVGATDTLQVALVGKIVANFTAGSEVEWTTASRNLIELKVERGVVAVRYDRRPSDPILQVRTPSAVVRVIGTVFTVQVDAEDNTAVSVLRGQVDIMKPDTSELLAEVESGSVYDVTTASYSDVSKLEVSAALPLSNEAQVDSGQIARQTGGSIPSSWYIPGLPEDGSQRTLAFVPAKISLADFEVKPVSRHPVAVRKELAVEPPAPRPVARSLEDEGEALIEHLMQDAKATRKKELRAKLAECDTLYHSLTKRYRAAGCLSDFLDKYGDEPAAVKGYLLVGMLRHDYAYDYRAAEKAFETFLRRAPEHPSAEFAHYRMWLSATEDGRISTAEKRARRYLQRYPNGKYVGKILQRFPKLKDEL